MAASTRGETDPWRRPASSSDSAQPSPMTAVSSHSRSEWRRKIVSAASRPAGVSDSSRPSAARTRPSAVNRASISEAACGETWRLRARTDACVVVSPSVMARTARR